MSQSEPAVTFQGRDVPLSELRTAFEQAMARVGTVGNAAERAALDREMRTVMLGVLEAGHALGEMTKAQIRATIAELKDQLATDGRKHPRPHKSKPAIRRVLTEALGRKAARLAVRGY